MSNGYKVLVLAMRDTVEVGTFAHIEGAMKALRTMKRQGRTVWIADMSGAFVPVKGASRNPLA